MKHPVRWGSLLPWISLGWFAALWAARWPAFPLPLDPAYHLFIARQVVEAGGPIAYEWWEHAPTGRPHLYPPVLHLLLAGFLKLGMPPLVVIRLASIALTPALLLTIFLVVRRLSGRVTALACLWVGLLPFAFHLHTAVAMAATLGLIELLWLLDAVSRGRWLAGGLLIALLWHTHLVVPWIALLVLAWYGVFRPPLRPTLLKSGWGMLLAVPWWIHLLRSRSAFHPVPRVEETLLELMPVLFGFAALGLWRCWRKGGPLAWLLACWAGSLSLAPWYRYRWMSGEGMLPVILLAGAGLSWAARRLAETAGRWLSRASSIRGVLSSGQPEGRVMFASFVLLLALSLSPTLARIDGRWQWRWPDAAPWHLMGSSAAARKSLDAGFSSPRFRQLAEAVGRLSRPGEILWSNAPYALGLIAALANRPIACSMLSEVSTEPAEDQVDSAHVIVWFKIAGLTAAALNRGRLTPVWEDELAVVFRQAGVSRTALPLRPVLPLGVGLAGLITAIGVIVWDVRRARQSLPKPV